jgi:hypothetical protein
VQTWRDRQWRNAAAAAPNGARRGFRTTAPAAAAAGDDNDDNENNKKKDEPEYREDSDDDDDDDFSDGEQDGEDVMPPRDMPLQGTSHHMHDGESHDQRTELPTLFV